MKQLNLFNNSSKFPVDGFESLSSSKDRTIAQEWRSGGAIRSHLWNPQIPSRVRGVCCVPMESKATFASTVILFRVVRDIWYKTEWCIEV
jgi:hypothetical protein